MAEPFGIQIDRVPSKATNKRGKQEEVEENKRIEKQAWDLVGILSRSLREEAIFFPSEEKCHLHSRRPSRAVITKGIAVD